MGADIETTEIINSEENYKKIRESKKIIREKRINHIRLITYEKEIKPEKIRSNVCISAIITSKARIKLHRAYKAVIENDGRILYSDTDSIFAAYKRNVINEKHGEIH
jgi:inosine/xanthosine triphosphate pyrophosphatase family protein